MLSRDEAAHRADEATAAAAAALAEAARRAEAVSAPVVICGFGELGQTVANMLDSPAVTHKCAPRGVPCPRGCRRLSLHVAIAGERLRSTHLAGGPLEFGSHMFCRSGGGVPYIAFDMQPNRIDEARAAGFNVRFGDASRPSVRCRARQHHKPLATFHIKMSQYSESGSEGHEQAASHEVGG